MTQAHWCVFFNSLFSKTKKYNPSHTASIAVIWQSVLSIILSPGEVVWEGMADEWLMRQGNVMCLERFRVGE